MNSRKTTSVLLVVATLLAGATSARAVDISGTLPGTLALPQVHGVLQPAGGGAPYESDFLGFNIAAYLDTGSSGIVISDFTASFLDLPTEPGVKYEDIAVGGTTQFDVSTPLRLRINTTNNPDIGNPATIDTVYDAVYDPVRAQVGPTDSFFDIFGMPAMIGKTTVIDPKQSDPVLLLSAPAYIYEPGTPYHPETADTNPGIPTASHHVELSYGDFTRFTQTTPAGAEGPTTTYNPFLGPNPLLALDDNPPVDNTPPVGLTFGGRQASGSFLLDTAGSSSFLSTQLAAQLGVRLVDPNDTENPQLEMFDPENPELPGTPIANQFTSDIEGLGGAITIAGFYLDEMILQTLEGGSNPANPNNIRYLGAPMLLLDITAEDPITGDEIVLDGTFGMNFLLDSLDISGTEFLERKSPYQWITFDEPNGILGLDLGIPVPEPSTMALAASGLLWMAFAGWRRGRRVPLLACPAVRTTAKTNTAGQASSGTVSRIPCSSSKPV